jgi:hypothetical protein
MGAEMSEADQAALAQVRAGATLFKSLETGARFVFNPDDADRPHCVMVRTARGYRHEIGGRQWSTGARVACYRLDR